MRRIIPILLCSVLLTGCVPLWSTDYLWPDDLETMTFSADKPVESVQKGNKPVASDVVNDRPVINDVPKNDREPASIIDSFLEDEKPLEIVDCGYQFLPEFEGQTYIEFCAIVHNPNNALTAEFPTLSFSVKDSNGKIAAYEEQVGDYILPNDTVVLHSQTSVETDKLNGAKFDFDINDTKYVAEVFDDRPPSSAYVVSNTSENQSTLGYTITGEVENTSDVDTNMIAITVIFKKNGKIVGHGYGYTDLVKAHSSTMFSVDEYNMPDHDSYDVYAEMWIY